jgi:hypothetical protein
MKKFIFVLSLFIGIAAHAQYPVSQSLGSSTTTTRIKGVTSSQFGVVYESVYGDTTSVNSNTTLETIGGITIRTGNNLWLRSQDATKWIQFGGANGIFTTGYNQNSMLNVPFRFLSVVQYNNGPVIPTATIQSEADSAWFRMSMVGNVPGKTGGYFITQSDSLNRLTSVGLNPTSDSTKGYQALFTKTGAYFGYRSGAVYNNAAATVSGISVDATTKVTISGLSLLLPRLTTAQRTGIVSPDEGLAVYDTTLHKLYIFDGTVWQGAW